MTTVIVDTALEHNRRVAWARYYQARRDLESALLLAAELAEWCDRVAAGLPPALVQAQQIARAAVPPGDLTIVQRFVRCSAGADIPA